MSKPNTFESPLAALSKTEKLRRKTEAVKAWCAAHLASARFVSLKGITSKTTAFREIARSLGIASSYTRTAKRI